MNYDKIKRLVKIVEESDIDSLELYFNFFGIKLYGFTVTKPRGAKRTIERRVKESIPIAEGPVCYEVKSEMVGTFYWNEDKSRRRFLRRKHKVKKGDILGYIEALKHMNEITSPCSGRIVKVYAKNDRPVDYGKVLFGIEAEQEQ